MQVGDHRNAMKKSVFSNRAMLTMSLLVFSIVVCQQGYRREEHGHDVKQSFEIGGFLEEQSGEPVKVGYSAIPASMRFEVVKPPASFDLTQLSAEWWKCPKTTKRPPFAVVVIAYKDQKEPSARVLIVEWKHVPGIAARLVSGISTLPVGSGARIGSAGAESLVGTTQGTDIAVFDPDPPSGRLKEMATWCHADPASLATLNSISGHLPGEEFLIRVRRQTQANSNARALATAVQSRAISTGAYDSKLTDYAKDFGGYIPVNPCTGTATGYTITMHKETADVFANAGTKCGTWTPMHFSLTL